MCGIVGILNRDRQKVVDPYLLSRMKEIMSHRGPDDEGSFISGSVGLGHRRLSVIDLASGHQPMIDKERGLVIVYNGEIYNFRELRKDLVGKGFKFETNCDTEVLLKLANLTSLDWLKKINGMFAFALWEESSKKLLLGRDRLGIKPLYYTNIGNEFIFASEIKPLLLHPKLQREVNLDRIPEYIAFRSICGTETMFKGIFELPPGHIMIISQENFQSRIEKFWEEGESENTFDFIDKNDSHENKLKKILQNSVNYRLVSDVAIGTYNSGGVDSSLITAMVRSITQGELHTFSVGFEEDSHDESKYAQIVADKIGTCHHKTIISEEKYYNSLPEALWHMEEPIGCPSIIPLIHLSRLAKKYVTVVLTGEGADEIFAGYPRLQIPFLANYLQFLPKIMSKGFLNLFRNLKKRRLVKLFEISHSVKKSVIENSRFASRSDFDMLFPDYTYFTKRDAIYEDSIRKQKCFLESILYYDRRAYLPALLNRLDKTSMAASVEARVAFLDHRLVEWSSFMPEKTKFKIGRGNKIILKKIAEQWFPKEILYRRKMGFDVPISLWLRNPKGLGQYLDILNDRTFKERGLFTSTTIEKLIKEHLSDTIEHNEILWCLLNLELWCRMFIDNNTLPWIMK